jgi:hypothetical protein
MVGGGVLCVKVGLFSAERREFLYTDSAVDFEVCSAGAVGGVVLAVGGLFKADSSVV